MRGFLCVVLLAAAAILTGCGSIGEPLYPALNIPTRITDLTAVERGDKIDVRFTIGPLTTEGLGLKQIGPVELRIGPNPIGGFQADAWAASAKRIDVPSPSAPSPVTVSAPAAEFVGKEVSVAVRVGNAKGRMSEWSNNVIINIIPPLAAPSAFKAEPVPEGVRLTWNAPGENAFRIYRKESQEQEPSLVATADKPEYLDTTSIYGKTYDYYVQAYRDKAESETVSSGSVTPKDIFPPRIPTGLTASIGINSIELAWERNSEADFKQYRVYRSEEGAPFVKVAEGLEGPAYSDRQVTSGKHYRYRITAEDQSGNESKPSEIVEATAP